MRTIFISLFLFLCLASGLAVPAANGRPAVIVRDDNSTMSVTGLYAAAIPSVNHTIVSFYVDIHGRATNGSHHCFRYAPSGPAIANIRDGRCPSLPSLRWTLSFADAAASFVGRVFEVRHELAGGARPTYARGQAMLPDWQFQMAKLSGSEDVAEVYVGPHDFDLSVVTIR